MPALLAPALTSVFVSIGVGAATAGILANVATLVIGVGFSLLTSAIFRPSQPPAPKPSDGQTIIRQPTAPRFRSYGIVKTGGVLVFAATQHGGLHRVIAMGSGEIDAVIEHWIDDTPVTLDGVEVTTPKYVSGGQPRAIIEYRHGEDDPALLVGLNAAYPAEWTADHKGRGVPHAYMLIHQVGSDQITDMFPLLGNTGYRQVQRAALVRDVIGGALQPAAWSDNAARIIMDYLTHPDGLNLADTWVEGAIAEWEAAIAVCNEAVPLRVGGTEPRWRIWMTYRFDERPADVLRRMLAACDGAVFPTPGGGMTIAVGEWIEPTVTIDDDAIVAFTDVAHGRNILHTANVIRARYTSPDHDYQETDADPWIDEADVAARGEYAIDLELYAVPSHAQARRLMKIAAHRANPEWSGVLTCNLRALPVMGERFIRVVMSELGIDGTFEVTGVTPLIEGTILTGVQVRIHSMTAAAYAWDAATEEGTPPPSPAAIAPQNDIPAPTGLGATFEA